ncbi:YxiJ family protein [Paenibacillus chitinolyticus]|uniref:YxiJ family protein n=1 Tax=Paenibacillus chitinolyticus TaxID=79263 RepID=UPI003640D8EA
MDTGYILKELVELNNNCLKKPFSYEDTKKLQKDFKKEFLAIQEESFNADFNDYCMIIVGTISYILKGKTAAIPPRQKDLLKLDFFDRFSQYSFLKDKLTLYSSLHDEYNNYEKARKLILKVI